MASCRERRMEQADRKQSGLILKAAVSAGKTGRGRVAVKYMAAHMDD